MTWICYVGVELSARTQQILLTVEVLTLTLFAVVALYKVYANNPPGSIHPAFSWFNPFAISSTSALTGGVLLGRVHLLGLGLRRGRERGERRPGVAARASRPSSPR